MRQGRCKIVQRFPITRRRVSFFLLAKGQLSLLCRLPMVNYRFMHSHCHFSISAVQHRQHHIAMHRLDRSMYFMCLISAAFWCALFRHIQQDRRKCLPRRVSPLSVCLEQIERKPLLFSGKSLEKTASRRGESPFLFSHVAHATQYASHYIFELPGTLEPWL